MAGFEIPLKMDEAPTATCFVCYSPSNSPDAYRLSLQTKHSRRSINTVLKMILCDESAPIWSESDAICFECVDKINDYDQAFEKMQLIERELKLLHRSKSLKPESHMEPAAAGVIACDDEYRADGFDVDNKDDDFSSDNSSNDPFDQPQPNEGPSNTCGDPTNTNVQRNSVVELTVNDEVSSELKKSDFHCDECGKVLPTCRGLTMHLNTMHKNAVRYECSACHEFFPNQHLLKKHEALASCWQCDFKCHICERSFPLEESLKKHMKKHNPSANPVSSKRKKSKFFCDECKRSFETKQGLMVHTFHFHIKTVLYECPVCHKTYRRKNHLEMHIASKCSKQKNFKCPTCPKRFTLQRSLKVHMITHGQSSGMVPPFDCDYCGTVFDDYKAFTDHRQIHLDRPKFQCLECERVVKRKQVLKIHMRVHTKETPHLCDICGKSFGRHEALRKHLQHHYGDFNAECYLCKHRVTAMDKLQIHMRIHTGEKPFSCDKCGKRFSERHNRDKHFRLHFGPTEKPHKCTKCSEAYDRPGLLSKHYLKAHGLQIQTTFKKLIKVKR